MYGGDLTKHQDIYIYFFFNRLWHFCPKVLSIFNSTYGSTEVWVTNVQMGNMETESDWNTVVCCALSAVLCSLALIVLGACVSTVPSCTQRRCTNCDYIDKEVWLICRLHVYPRLSAGSSHVLYSCEILWLCESTNSSYLYFWFCARNSGLRIARWVFNHSLSTYNSTFTCDWWNKSDLFWHRNCHGQAIIYGCKARISPVCNCNSVYLSNIHQHVLQ
jgi:hypothetical protein